MSPRARPRPLAEAAAARAPAVTRALSLGPARRRVVAADGLIADGDREPLYRFFRGLPYRFEDSDRMDTQQYRHLGYRFDDEPLLDHPVVGYFARAATALLAARRLRVARLKRATVNFNLHGDVQFAHEDGDEWTAVAFVNATWHEDWGGELMIYDPDDAARAHAFVPVPGRMVVFDGLLRHRGGVPTRLCAEPRITLALKFAR